MFEYRYMEPVVQKVTLIPASQVAGKPSNLRETQESGSECPETAPSMLNS